MLAWGSCGLASVDCIRKVAEKLRAEDGLLRKCEVSLVKRMLQALEHSWFTQGRIEKRASGDNLDLEGSFRGIKMFVVARKLQHAVVLLLGVYLTETKVRALALAHGGF